MKRVIVIGCAGSGKSTFSKQIGERTGLPVVHLDAHYWKPGWIAAESESFDREMQRIMQADSWIMDGNYSRTLDMRLDRADTVILFDLPRYLCLYRIIKRRLQYHGQTRVDMGAGCVEKLDFAFIRWVWNFRKRSRPKLLSRLHQVRGSHNVVIFRSPKEVRRYLESMQGAE